MRLVILIGVVFILVMTSCIRNSQESDYAECEACPEPIAIVIPEILFENDSTVMFIRDAEHMFNKWSRKAFLLAEEIAANSASADSGTSEPRKSSGSITLKMFSYLAEFNAESAKMEQRKQILLKSMNQTEKEAFQEVINQFEERMDLVITEIEKLGVKLPLSGDEISKKARN